MALNAPEGCIKATVIPYYFFCCLGKPAPGAFLPEREAQADSKISWFLCFTWYLEMPYPASRSSLLLALPMCVAG